MRRWEIELGGIHRLCMRQEIPAYYTLWRLCGEEKKRLALLKLFIVAKISLSISRSPLNPEEMITASATNERRELLAAAPRWQ